MRPSEAPGMSGPIRLVISDIDGTLVGHDKALSPGNVAAIGRLVAAGVPFSLISARPPSGMIWIAERLGLKHPIGAFNGGTLVQPDGTIISADRIAPDIAARALKLLDRPGITPWLFADGAWYAVTTANQYVPRERKAANVEPVILPDFSSLTGPADKIVGVSDDHALLASLEPEVQAALGDGATVARSQVYYLDVTSPHGNKGDGIVAIAKAVGVPLDQVAVFGDQRNDLPMFARAGFSVAMGQAPDEVRAAATETARTNDEDGVADAIERFVLPRLQR